MTTGDFRKLFENVPFKPFRLVMSSGETVEVRHPENAMMTRTSILVSELKPNRRLGDNYDLYSLLHVTRVQFIDEPESATAG